MTFGGSFLNLEAENAALHTEVKRLKNEQYERIIQENLKEDARAHWQTTEERAEKAEAEVRRLKMQLDNFRSNGDHSECEDRWYIEHARAEKAEAEATRLRDMAGIGEAFMARLPKDYRWNECPTEFLVDVQNERDILRGNLTLKCAERDAAREVVRDA